MNNLKYKLNHISPVNQSWLEENHFFWSDTYNAYIKRLNVWHISDTESVYGEIRLDPESNFVNFEVYTAPKTYYGPYYYAQWTSDATEEVETINKRIKNEFDYLGIVLDQTRSEQPPWIYHSEFRGYEDD